MFCNKCGAQIEEGAKFCPVCGAQIIANQPQNSYYEPEQNTYSTVQNPYNQPVEQGPGLTWGILALVFACSFFASFLGIIFGAVGLSKANGYLSLCGELTGKNKVGRILSKAGLIVGIILTVIFLFYIVIIGLAAATIY